jgi:hypothetical protein
MPIKMKFSGFIFCFLFLGKVLSGTGSSLYPGARFGALGGAGSTLSDVWSAGYNQAGLAFMENPEFSAFFENRFLISGLSNTAFAGCLPVSSGTFGIIHSSFGSPVFKESKSGISYGRKLGPNIAAGICLNYITLRQGGDYGSMGFPAAELGFLARVNKEFSIAAHIFNPWSKTLDPRTKERFPLILRTGMAYAFSEKVSAVLEIEKNIYFRPSVKGGIEYNPGKQVFVRAGFSTNPGVSTAGFGFRPGNFSIDLSTQYHPVLGFSPQANISYRFDRKKES